MSTTRREFLKTLAGLVLAPGLALKAMESARRERAEKKAIESMVRYQNAIFDAFDEAKIDLWALPGLKCPDAGLVIGYAARSSIEIDGQHWVEVNVSPRSAQELQADVNRLIEHYYRRKPDRTL